MSKQFNEIKSFIKKDSSSPKSVRKIEFGTVEDKKVIASIIIPTIHPDEKLIECISYLERQSEKNFELIIIDNGSDYDFSNLICSLKHVIIIKNDKNYGFSKAINKGISVSRGKYFVLLNDDAYPTEKWLENLIEIAENDEKIGLVTSKLRFNAPPYLIQNTGTINSKITGVGISRDIGRREPSAKNGSEVLAPCGAALLIKKEFIEDVGMLDEDYFAYSEDKDLGLRGWIKGWKCVYSDAEVFHDHSNTGKQFSEVKTYYVVRNEILLAFKLYPLKKLIRYLLFKNTSYYIYLKYFILSKNNRNKSNKKSGILKLAFIVLEAHFDAIKLIPKILQKRTAIWKTARITKKEFTAILEKFVVSNKDLLNEIGILNEFG
jgi:GT2 family glycosyltransferase